MTTWTPRLRNGEALPTRKDERWTPIHRRMREDHEKRVQEAQKRLQEVDKNSPERDELERILWADPAPMVGDIVENLFVCVGRNRAPHVLYGLRLTGIISHYELPSLLAYSWTLCEHPTRVLDVEIWLEMFEEAGYHDGDGNPLERPEESITAYRGSLPDNRYGMAWTTDREKAQWFANRIPDGRVYECEIEPDWLLADYRNGGRGENELVVDPYCLVSEIREIGKGVPVGGA